VAKAHFAMFLVALIYAGNYTIAKIVMPDYIEPLGFILLRVTTGTLVLWLLHTLFIKEPIERKDFIRIGLCGLFGVAINQMMFFKGLNWTTPINASLIMTTTPILVLIISAILLKEAITARKIIGIALGIVGATIIILFGASASFSRQSMLGDLMIFINATSFGIYLVLAKKLLDKYHPFTVLKWTFTVGWFIVLPFGWPDIPAIAWESFDLNIWLAVLYVLIVVSVGAYILNVYALKKLNASTVSTYVYLQPILASLIALLVGKDELTLFKVAAAIIIFYGVYLVSTPRKPN